MATGDEKVNPALKRFLSQNRISENLIDYLHNQNLDLGTMIFPQQGLFTYPVTITPGSGDFDLSITPSGTISGTDGLGHKLELVTARQTNISFEHGSGETYWVGAKHIQIPSGVYNNPRTSEVEYDKNMDEVGELEEPTSVVDSGTYITINVNSIFESGVDHSGRSVRVWLKNPIDEDAAVAFEDCVVAYSSPNNTITTSGLLGQSTVSEVVTDYQVACLGVSVRKSVSNPFGDEYLIFGSIIDAAADTSDQKDLSGGGGHTLQKAYDGAGSGAGRNVTSDDGAITVQSGQTTFFEHDVYGSVLRLLKDLDRTASITTDPLNYETALDILLRFHAAGGVIVRNNLFDLSGNDFLRGEEDVDVTDADTITFTRVGVDLTFTGEAAALIPSEDLIEISGSALGNDGVYLFTNIGGTTVDVRYLNGSTPVLTAETSNPNLKASLYRPSCTIGLEFGRTRLIATDDFQEDGSFDLGPVFEILASSGMDGTRDLIRCSQNGGITSFKLDADGDAEIGKDLAVTGKITSDAVGYAIEATNASGDIHATRNVVATNNVSALQDVVAGQNVTAIAGDVTASGSGGDFKYSSAKTYEKVIGIGAFANAHDNADGEWSNADSSPYWQYTTSSGGGNLVGDLNLPDGATITKVEAVIYSVSGGGVSITVNEHDPDFGGSPPSPSDQSIVNVANSGSDAWETIEDTTISPNVVDNTTHGYEIVIRALATGERFAGVKVTYQLTIIKPQ